MGRWLRLAKTQKPHSEIQTQNRAHIAYLQGLQAGDQAAWKQFTAEWSPCLYSYIRYLLRDAEEAQALVSETLLAVVQAIRSFDGRVTPVVFIYSIAYRQITAYRRQAPIKASAEQRSTDPSYTNRALAALAMLPEQAQQILLLRYHVGLSVAEIAEILGYSAQATEALLSHVRHQFEIAFLRSAEL